MQCNADLSLLSMRAYINLYALMLHTVYRSNKKYLQ